MVHKKLIYVHKSLIEFGNKKTDKKKVEKIAAHLNPDRVGAFTGYLDPHTLKVKLTDGNHRCKALIMREYDYVPCILLTTEEYIFVAYTENVIDMMVDARPPVYKLGPLQ